MKILVVDDHALVRQGICALLLRDQPGADVLQARGLTEAIDLAAAHDDLDVVFLDLSLPGVQGLDGLRALGQARPALPVIVVSAIEDPPRVREAFEAGALGYVPKSASLDTLLTALSLVMRGELFVPSLVLQRSVQAPEPAAAVRERLTERQVEALKWLGQGLSNKSIARQMGVSEKTVKAHMSALFRTLSVDGRARAVEAARVAGLI